MSKRRQKTEKFQHERRPEPIRPLTDNQGVYLDALKVSEQLVVMGPAGTGKTFIAGTHAADQLRTHRVGRVIITRPNVPAGRSLGFFPGSLEEKFAPWVAPLAGVISDRLGANVYENAVRNGDIVVVPFETMRGSSWDNALIILDEAQNTTPLEMKMFLTRIGKDSQVIINGDVNQTDLKETSGLRKVIHMVKSYALPVPIIEFTMDDIVRSDICAQWVRAFHQEGI